MKKLIIIAIALALFVGLTKAPKKARIEQELLANARQNIEKYRKGDASLVLVDTHRKPVFLYDQPGGPRG